jgi:hypothetical protein
MKCQDIADSHYGVWELWETRPRFPRRGGRVLCVHGAGSFHARVQRSRYACSSIAWPSRYTIKRWAATSIVART